MTDLQSNRHVASNLANENPIKLHFAKAITIPHNLEYQDDDGQPRPPEHDLSKLK